MKTKIEYLREAVESERTRSAWDRGVKVYALELVDELAEAIECEYFQMEDIAAPKLLAAQLLNGATNWQQYSWGGCSLIYDEDIARRLCCPSELKKTRNGERRPNSREEWLDVQARALRQASYKILRLAKKV